MELKSSQNSYRWLSRIHVDPPRSDGDLPDTDSSVIWDPFFQTFTRPGPELKPWPVFPLLHCRWIMEGCRNMKGPERWGSDEQTGSRLFAFVTYLSLVSFSFVIHKGQGWLCASSHIIFSKDECSLLQPPIVWVSWGASAKVGKLITRNLEGAQPLDLYLTSFVSSEGSGHPSFCHEWCFV